MSSCAPRARASSAAFWAAARDSGDPSTPTRSVFMVGLRTAKWCERGTGYAPADQRRPSHGSSCNDPSISPPNVGHPPARTTGYINHMQARDTRAIDPVRAADEIERTLRQQVFGAL